MLLFYRILLLNFKRTASEDISGTNIDYKNLVLFSLLSLYCESYVTSFMTRARLKFDVEVGKKFFKSNIRQKKVERSPLWWLVSGTYSTHTVHYSVWTMIFIIPRFNIIIIELFHSLSYGHKKDNVGYDGQYDGQHDGQSHTYNMIENE